MPYSFTTADAKDAAQNVGLRLCADAKWSGDVCTWIVPRVARLRGTCAIVNGRCGPSLYSGTSGIAVFLARLYFVTGNPSFAVTARGAMFAACRDAKALIATGTYGLYNGIAGIALACCEVGDSLQDEFYVASGTSLLNALAAAPAPDDFDLVSGTAGMIVALLYGGKYRRSPAFEAAAVRLGRALVAAAIEADEGIAWDSERPPRYPFLTGLAHGASGVAWALAELANITGDDVFKRSAEDAVAYERYHFDPIRANWPDFYPVRRCEEGAPAYPVAWCKGAGGIGLVRFRLYDLWNDRTCLTEAQTAVRIVEGQPFLQNADFSLCHGLGGNAELSLAAQAYGRSNQYAMTVAQYGIEQYLIAQRWPCGEGKTENLPGLMVGLAGIGYFYLRCADPSVPSMVLPICTAPTSSSTSTF